MYNTFLNQVKVFFLKGTLLASIFIVAYQYGSGQSWPEDTIDQVHINSGNPNYPFPQFLSYQQGRNLGRHQATGVVHKEMEKQMRDAYKIMMNRAIYSGESLNGKDYIMFNHGAVPQNYGTFVSEGDGYALLAAAYMADKETFDGLWLWIHDHRLSGEEVIRYQDCDSLRPGYQYGTYTAGWQNDENTNLGSGDLNSAADGSYDIGLALLVAYKQWGDNMGINDACGNPISYREAALNFVTNMVDTVYWDDGSGGVSGNSGYLSGCIGIDGYFKSGNTWDELTQWSYNNAASPQPASGVLQNTSEHFDYTAPAYFHQFAEFLREENESSWNIRQYRRGEMSSDWLMGEAYDQGLVPQIGHVEVNDDGSNVTFSNIGAGEDFRLPWRTTLNYVWHGNPDSTWDPVEHDIDAGGNTYERDMALRMAEAIRNAGKAGPVSPDSCEKLGMDPTDIRYTGPPLLRQGYNMDGTILDNYITNWVGGAASPAIVADGGMNLLARVYRRMVVEWDAVETGAPYSEYERYLGNTPKYFHGWYRLLGMLTLTGNMHKPSRIEPIANVRVYKDVDKTYAFPEDEIHYTISYRNYGKKDAQDVVITDTIPEAFEYVSSTGGGTFNSGNNVVQWDIGTVPGFETGGKDATIDSVELTVRVKPSTDSGRFCKQARITASNGYGGKSNQYPNNITATMERNCVDIVDRALRVDKELTTRDRVNPGDSVHFKIDFENSSKAGWLDGGRPRVRFTHGQNYPNGTDGFNAYFFFRLLHGAHEPYINYGNYRVSYYINEPAVNSISEGAGDPGWYLRSDIYEGGEFDDLIFNLQKIPYGSDAEGSWDQRLIMQFADQLAGPANHLYQQWQNEHRIHRGNLFPLRAKFILRRRSSQDIDWTDDWSFGYPEWETSEKQQYHPITPSWADPQNPNVPVDKWHVAECRTADQTVDRVLIEEYDGYTWRRVFGTGPMPGRQIQDVVVKDTLPEELEWGGFTQQQALDSNATYDPATRVITWKVPRMLVGAEGTISYYAYAKSESDLGGCDLDTNAINKAWIYGKTESPKYAADTVNITCADLPPPPPETTTMTKEADKEIVSEGDTVNYTVSLKNTQGTIANPDLYTSGDSNSIHDHWSSRNGSALPDFSQWNQPWDGPKFFTHDYSHGTNGVAEFNVVPNFHEEFSFVFRHQGGTPGNGDFNGVALRIEPGPTGAGSVVMQAYNNQTGVTETYNGGYPNPPADTINFRIRLNADTMQVWINDFSGPPIYETTNISVGQPGHIGIYNGDITGSGTEQGPHQLLNWWTHFGSAFDVELVDRLPENLSFISSSEGGLVGDTVRWQYVSDTTPMLYADSISFQIQAEVDSCGEIINTAYANMKGQPYNSIGAQNIISCNEPTPVRFISFTAERQENKHVQLKWATAWEQSSKKFLIQRSKDGQSFTTAGNIVAQGNSASRSEYSFTDKNADPSRSWYYRIVEIDKNGSRMKSAVRQVDGIPEPSVRFYPNPFNSYTTLLVRYPEPGTYRFKIHDMTGRPVNAGTKSYNQPVRLGNNLSRGAYHIKIFAEEKIYHKKLIKN